LEQSGTFTTVYSGKTIATGGYTLANGSFSGYTDELLLQFNTYNPSGFSGFQQTTTTFSPALPSGMYVYPGAAGGLWTSTQATMPVQLDVFYSGSGQYYGIVGQYTLTDNMTASNTYSVTDSGGTNLVTMSVKKNSFNTQVSVFNSTSGALIYQDPTPISSADESLIPILKASNGMIFQSNFYGSFPVNSSVYFTGNSFSVAFSPNPASVNQIIIPTISNNGFTLSGTGLNTLSYIRLEDDTTGLSTDELNVTSGYSPNMATYTYYKLANGTWAYNSGGPMLFVQNMIGSTLSSLAGFTLTQPGVHNITAVLIDNYQNTYTMSTNVTVSGTASPFSLTISPYDEVNQQAISGSTICVFDPVSQKWTNTTTSSTVTIPVTYGLSYGIQVSAPNYATSPFTNFAITQANGFSPSSPGTSLYMVGLYPTNANLPANNVSMAVQVTNAATGFGLVGARVSVTSLTVGNTYSQSSTTTASGIFSLASFTVPTNATYRVAASYTGFQTGTSTVVVTTVSPVNVPIQLTTAVVVPTPTPTVTATTTIPGYSPSTGNYTGFFAPIENGIASAGALPSEMGLLMASLFIFVGACIGGLRGDGSGIHPVGAGIGGAIGFVLACAFGLISFIWVAAFVFVALAIAILFGRG
jgi:hypothetical protein